MITDFIVLTHAPTPSYNHRVKSNLTVDGQPYSGNTELFMPGNTRYLYGTHTNDGSVDIPFLPENVSDENFCLLILKEGRPFATELIKPDNVVIYDLAISTTGGSVPTGNPGIITGKVERILDGQAQPAARRLVALENKPDGSWGVTGNATSDTDTGQYTLDVLTDGGDTFVIAMDDYGRVFTPSANVDLNEIIHPTIPNGFVYRVEQAGTLPDSEPDWWVDTGTNHTKTIGDVSLRAIAFYRPLCHGPVIAEQS